MPVEDAIPEVAVRLEPHSGSWKALYLAEAPAIREALGALAVDVQHIGSTAVPGLDAKPIVDIGAAVEDPVRGLDCVPLLEALGYTYRGDLGIFGGHFFVRDLETPRAIHLHVVGRDEALWRGYLGLRDLLRASPEARDRYQARKRELAALHPDDRDAYTRGKTEVILKLIAESERA